MLLPISNNYIRQIVNTDRHIYTDIYIYIHIYIYIYMYIYIYTYIYIYIYVNVHTYYYMICHIDIAIRKSSRHQPHHATMEVPELPCWVDQIEGQANFRISRLWSHILDQVGQPRLLRLDSFGGCEFGRQRSQNKPFQD